MNLLKITSIMECIIIPSFLFLWILCSKKCDLIDWILKIIMSISFLLLLNTIAYWQHFSIYLPYAIFMIFIIVCYFSYKKVKSCDDYNMKKYRKLIHRILIVFLSIFFTTIFIGALKSKNYSEEAINLSFPLRNGKYTITDGGDGKISPLMNYHYMFLTVNKFKTLLTKSDSWDNNSKLQSGDRYAVDVVKLNNIGALSKKILPHEINNYEIYEDDIYSPCDGQAIEVVDNYDNNIPLTGGYPKNVGNHVIIKFNNSNKAIVLGHMQKDSIKIKSGDIVKEGQIIGKVGNSGWSEWPHVHIKVMEMKDDNFWNGEPVPFTFDNKVPFKNRVYFK